MAQGSGASWRREACMQKRGVSDLHTLSRSHLVSRRSPHSRATGPRTDAFFPWSEGFDRIFRNEEVTGSNPVSSTKRAGQGVVGDLERRCLNDLRRPLHHECSTGSMPRAPRRMRGAFSLGLTSITSEIAPSRSRGSQKGGPAPLIDDQPHPPEVFFEYLNGWRYSAAGGRAGHDFALRGAFVKNLLGALVAEEALYVNCRVDEQDQPLTGEHRYTLRFEAGELPPLSIFWNLAMYDEHEFFTENDAGRYTIGSTTEGLRSENEGSLTLYL